MTCWGEMRGGWALTSESTAMLQSLIQILTRAVNPEGMAQSQRGTRGQWNLRRQQQEKSCKDEDDSSRLW